MSWNWGILLGEIVGYVIVFTGEGNDFAAFIFSWGAMLFMIACGVALEKPRVSLQFIDEKGMAAEGAIPQEYQSSSARNPALAAKEVKRPKNLLLAFPALFYLLGTLIYGYVKNFYPVVYPLTLDSAGQASYWVYLVTFGHQFVQMSTIWPSLD